MPRSLPRSFAFRMARLMHFLYSVLLAAGMLLSLPYWLFQMLRHGKYRRGLTERLGWVPARLRSSGKSAGDGSPARVIWVHAVSVGEVLAISGLVDKMRQSLPNWRVVVSTTTDTGQTLARKRVGESNVFYFPMDFAFAIRPYLQALRPELVVLAETDSWPDFRRLAAKRSIGRCGECQDFETARCRGSPISLGIAERLANVDILADTAEDVDDSNPIGAGAGKVMVTGNLKVRTLLPSPPPIVESLRRSLAEAGAGPVLVCGSTVEDEEALLLKAFESILVAHPNAVMILAPRHPERFDTVAKLLGQMSLRFVRRSRWNFGAEAEPLSGSVLLVDTIGELAALYALADIAFVGAGVGTPRRAEHYRTRAARRGDRHRQPYGKFPRYRKFVSKPRCGANCRSSRVAFDPHGTFGGRSRAAGAGQTRRRNHAIADRIDHANSGGAAHSHG